MASEEWAGLQVNEEWKRQDGARKNLLTAEAAIRRTYLDLYETLNQGNGRAGITEWEHDNLTSRLNNFQITAILGRNFALSSEAFIDYANKIVPTRDLYCVR